MYSTYKHLLLLFLLIAVSLSACQKTSTSTTPTVRMPPDVPTTVPAETQPAAQPSPTAIFPIGDEPSEQVLLWAAEANASSAAGETGYDAWQAVGAPNTFACGDYVTAWQPAPAETEAWIELAFFPYILPYEIQIVHSFLPGQVSKIEVITLEDEALTVFDAAQGPYLEMPDCPVTRVITTDSVDVLIRVVRITLVRDAAAAWTQIDAVGVLGLVGEELGEVPLELPQEIEPGDVRYYSNKNQITSLTFAGNQLWAASLGGVTAWDLDSLSYTTFSVADGLSSNTTYAITFCDWDGGMIAAGGSGGISLLALDGAPVFEALDHPDFEELYGVRSLMCDPIQQQLWVGYFDRLSRYDFAAQTWQEFTTSDGLPEGMPRQITFLNEDLWVVMEYGIAILRGGEVLESYPPESSIMPSLFVHGAAIDKKGIIWMATSEGLRSKTYFGWQTWGSVRIDGGEMTALLMGLAANSDGTFWLGDHFGTLCRFDPILQQCLQVVSAPEDITLSTLAATERGWAAIGSHDDGIYLLADGEWFRLRTNDQALNNIIYGLTYTPDGRIWLVGEAGLQYLQASDPDTEWGVVPLPQDGRPFSLYTANDGLWIGHTQGATFLPYIGEDVLHLPSGSEGTAIAGTVTAIVKDAAGRMFFGTDKGLSVWDGNTYQYFDLLNDQQRQMSTYPPRVNCILRDGENMWVGSRSGLHQFVNGSLVQSLKNALQAVSTYNVASVGVLSLHPQDESLLVGIGSELFVFDRENFEKVLELPSEIRSLYRAPYALWIATASSGIWSVPMDSSGVYWEAADRSANFTHNFGYQAIVMSDPYTLWFAGMEGGLERRTGMFGQ